MPTALSDIWQIGNLSWLTAGMRSALAGTLPICHLHLQLLPSNWKANLPTALIDTWLICQMHLTSFPYYATPIFSRIICSQEGGVSALLRPISCQSPRHCFLIGCKSVTHYLISEGILFKKNWWSSTVNRRNARHNRTLASIEPSVGCL